MADGLDEQLHETCGGLVPHSISPPVLARRLPLVPGETFMQEQNAPAYITCTATHSNLLTESNTNLCLGHPIGCRCCHRCHDVAEWGHVWSGPLELCHAPSRCSNDM